MGSVGPVLEVPLPKIRATVGTTTRLLNNMQATKTIGSGKASCP